MHKYVYIYITPLVEKGHTFGKKGSISFEMSKLNYLTVDTYKT